MDEYLKVSSIGKRINNRIETCHHILTAIYIRYPRDRKRNVKLECIQHDFPLIKHFTRFSTMLKLIDAKEINFDNINFSDLH